MIDLRNIITARNVTMQYRRAALHCWAHLHRSHAQLDPSTRYRYVAKRKYTLPLLDLGPQNGSPLRLCHITLHASLPNRYRTVPDRMVQSHSSTWPGLTITGLNTQHFALTGDHRTKPRLHRTLRDARTRNRYHTSLVTTTLHRYCSPSNSTVPKQHLTRLNLC